MKKVLPCFLIILIGCCVCSVFIPVNASIEINEDSITQKNHLTESCHHSMLYSFDHNEMQIDGVYEGNRIEMLILDVEYYGDTAQVYMNDNEVTNGYLEEGMTVHIYHQGVLYGIYEINHLLENVTRG